MILKKSEFFSWCARHGLTETSDVVSVIPVSGQTVRNWMNKRKDDEELAPWVYFATRYYDETAGRDADLRGYHESAGEDARPSITGSSATGSLATSPSLAPATTSAFNR
jgi:hypothetical protein